ncbi:MAG: glycosyltransferase family 2 protein [Berryella intestinalis]|uniref:glycosyltransferase family 2 protein n=1 Tax=Berryella intestinalis TaxID=1531429 RepID=UPI002A558FA2|nr:glycosyltransferase family 2 protein [Berryella intestinalis]MDD7369696.1 glycosyltransferase family 2 protein [Berryella intestinalis]MDY3128607.1 glycosyltransferase family 2 protein [Berryella intestinalis]
MPKVSIIVPVYNAASVLERCIDSILCQTLADFELLLIDDGSEDSSPLICDDYANRDARVKVVHKRNAGVSMARNTALDLACGDYLQFVDADDWIAPDCTQNMVGAIEESGCDMVIADFYRVVNEWAAVKGSISGQGPLTREEYGDLLLENPADYYFGALWNKLFRRSIVEEFSLRMDPQLSWCEDFIFNMEYVLHASTVFPLHAPGYYYVKTEGSLVSQGMNVADVVRMKLNVVEYYRDFYRRLYDERDYRARRLGVYRFLVEFSHDDAAIPFVSESKRLSLDEDVPASEGLGRADSFFGLCRQRVLFDRALEEVAGEFELDVRDVELLLYLRNAGERRSVQEAAELLGLSPIAIAASLQKLVARRFVPIGSAESLSDVASNLQLPLREQMMTLLDVSLTPQADALLRKVDRVCGQFEAMRSSRLDADEREVFERLERKVSEAVGEVLGR